MRRYCGGNGEPEGLDGDEGESHARAADSLGDVAVDDGEDEESDKKKRKKGNQSRRNKEGSLRWTYAMAEKLFQLRLMLHPPLARCAASCL